MKIKIRKSGDLAAASLLLAGMMLAPSARASTLSDQAASMKPGEWKELKTTGLNDTLLHLQSIGTLWWANKHTDWSNYLSWNPASKEVLFLGAGHLRPYGFMRYDSKSNNWDIDSNVPECMTKDGYNGCFNHGYHQGTIDSEKGIFYFYSEQNWFSLDIASGKWNQWSLSGFSATRGSGIEWYPALKKLAWVNGGKVRLIDPATKEVEDVAKDLAMGAYNNTMTYNPVTEKIYLGGGFGTKAFYALGKDKKVVKLADAPSTYDCSASNLTADAVTGEVLLVSNDNNLYVYNPEKNVWTAGAKPIAELNKGEDMAVTATAIPEYGVTYYMSPNLKKVYLYRHAAGTGTPLAVKRPVSPRGLRPGEGEKSTDAAGRRAVGRTIRFSLKP